MQTEEELIKQQWLIEAFKAGAQWATINKAYHWDSLPIDAKHYAKTGEIKRRPPRPGDRSK